EGGERHADLKGEVTGAGGGGNADDVEPLGDGLAEGTDEPVRGGARAETELHPVADVGVDGGLSGGPLGLVLGGLRVHAVVSWCGGGCRGSGDRGRERGEATGADGIGEGRAPRHVPVGDAGAR